MESRADPPVEASRLNPVAPLWHTLGLLLILLAISVGLSRTQSRTTEASEPRQSNVLPYLAVTVSEWALAGWVWLGGFIPGATRLRDLVGGSWSRMKNVLRDIAIGVVAWIVVTAAAVGLSIVLGPSHLESMGFLSPRGAAEVALWVGMSITAGFCEELVYRGYLQQQVLALTGSAAVAVLAQGVLFGVAHWYQGVKMVGVIAVIGVILGILAQWRKSLRPGMIAHALGDIVNLIAVGLA